MYVSLSCIALLLLKISAVCRKVLSSTNTGLKVYIAEGWRLPDYETTNILRSSGDQFWMAGEHGDGVVYPVILRHVLVLPCLFPLGSAATIREIPQPE